MPLLERDTQLRVLGQLLDTVAGGGGGALLVEGEAGSGKTSLLRSLTSDAVTMRTARGAEIESRFPFGVARQLLRGQSLPERELDPRSAAYELTAMVAAGAEQGPQLLRIDDAHWADAASLGWLAQLARDAHDIPVGVVVAARPSEPGAPVELADLRAATASVELCPLAPESVAELVRSRVPDADAALCRACAAATGGNPLLTHAVLDALLVDGDAPTAARIETLAPRSVVAGVTVRLERLGADATALAEAVAVLERDVRLSDAAALAGLDLERAAAAADRLRAVRLLGGERELSFVHPLLRTGVYEGIPADARRERHRTSARLLRDRGEAPERVAGHLVLTHPAGDGDTAASLQAAAGAAMRQGDPASAATLLERALDEPPRPEQRHAVVVDLARAEDAAGRAPQDVAARVLQAIESAADPRDAARAGIALGLAGIRSGRMADLLPAMERTLAQLPADELDLRVELERGILFAASYDAGTVARFRDRAAELAELPGATPGERLLLVEAARWLALHGGTRTEVEALLGRAGEQHGINLLVSGWALSWVESDAWAAECFDRALAQARAVSSVPLMLQALIYRGVLTLETGDLRQGQADIETAAALVGDVPLRAMIDAARNAACRMRGQLDEACRIAAGIDLDRYPVTMLQRSVAASQVAETEIACREFASAERRMRETAAAEERAGVRSLWRGWRIPLAEALNGLGRHQEARQHATDHAREAERIGAPRNAAAALLAAALACRDPNPDELAAVVEKARGAGSAYWLARALVEHGAALRRGRDRRLAREPLGEALDIAVRHGADGIAARAREELQAAGARPRNEVRRGVDALSASEFRVARLAAQDMTNGEIARTLFVSHKTVESQMSSVLRKLSLSSRREVAAALAGS